MGEHQAYVSVPSPVRDAHTADGLSHHSDLYQKKARGIQWMPWAFEDSKSSVVRKEGDVYGKHEA